MENVIHREQNENLENYSLSQIKAGPYAAEQVSAATKEQNTLSELFPPIEILKSGRTICGITAVSAGINVLKGRREIGDAGNEDFLVGDFYRFLLPYQGYKSTNQQDGYENGWWVINPTTKDVYHHALVAWAESFDCETSQVNGFQRIEDLADFFKTKGVAIVSVSNKFVKEVTTGNDPACFVEKDGKTFMLIQNEDGTITEREFRTNTHLLTVASLDILKGEVTLLDSFALRQQKNKNHARTIPISTFNKYLIPGKEKAILLSGQRILASENYKVVATYIPDEIRQLLWDKIIKSHTK